VAHPRAAVHPAARAEPGRPRVRPGMPRPARRVRHGAGSRPGSPRAGSAARERLVHRVGSGPCGQGSPRAGRGMARPARSRDPPGAGSPRAPVRPAARRTGHRRRRRPVRL